MKSLTFRKLKKILTSHDPRFKFFKSKGKGSHRAIEHPSISGKPVAFTIPVHGEGQDIKTPYLTTMKRRFQLPPDIFD